MLALLQYLNVRYRESFFLRRPVVGWEWERGEGFAKQHKKKKGEKGKEATPPL